MRFLVGGLQKQQAFLRLLAVDAHLLLVAVGLDGHLLKVLLEVVAEERELETAAPWNEPWHSRPLQPARLTKGTICRRKLGSSAAASVANRCSAVRMGASFAKTEPVRNSKPDRSKSAWRISVVVLTGP